MNRKAIFIRWWVHQLRTYDCDPAIYVMKYIIDRMELNSEQRFWFCWIYANTYQVATAWVIFNEFPDYENVPQDRIEKFSRENAHRLPYQKDQKWLRGCLGETFASYHANLGTLNQAEYWNLMLGENPQTNFNNCWQTVLNCHRKFGRYTAWFYLQALKEICGLNLEPTSLMLSFDASATHRAGLCLALGLDELAQKGAKFDKETLLLLELEAAAIANEVQDIFGAEGNSLPVSPDLFSMETSLCSFKKLFRRQQGRYLGYYLDRLAEDINKTAHCGWPGINWDLLWAARDEVLLPELNHHRIDPAKFHLFLDTDLFTDDLDLLNRLDDWAAKRAPMFT